MKPRVHFITLPVRDLDAARRFYVDGLGWTPLLDVAGEVIFIQVGPGLLLALFASDERVTLSHNVDSAAEVAEVLDQVRASGGTIVRPAAPAAEFAGTSGLFEDPDGHRWEVAHNPGWGVDPDGRVHIGPA
jgi:catechol 2,3-dioxygenase-like lactoylglutathione lyase family enzyme